MCDVILINLTRLGDLLQTQALITDLHKSGLGVGLVCLENFAPAAEMMRHLSRVWPFPGAKVSASLDRNWHEALQLVENFGRTVNEDCKAKYVLNLTPTLPARLLAKILGSDHARIIGFGLDEFGYGVNDSEWASFFAVAAQKRHNAPFNVADMLRCLALSLTHGLQNDFRLKSPEQDKKWASGFIEQANIKGKRLIAFQLGASEERRRWPVENFLTLGKKLYREHGFVPVLLGSSQETSLGEEYARGADHPFINAIGKTNLGQLGALLERAELLVTNDTGTMHLASGLGVKSLAIFLATAQPWDTGPMLDGCCCLEPALECHPCAFGQECVHGGKCRRQISGGSAYSLIDGWLASGTWNAGINTDVNRECRVWVTSHDEDGFALARCINEHASEGRILWLQWLRAYWRQLLGAMTAKKQIPDNSEPFNGLALARSFSGEVKVLRDAAVIMDSLVACGRLLAKNPQAGRLFLKNCERVQNLLLTSPPLGTLAAFWKEYRQSQGDRLESFLTGIQILARSYHQLADAIETAAKNGRIIA